MGEAFQGNQPAIIKLTDSVERCIRHVLMCQRIQCASLLLPNWALLLAVARSAFVSGRSCCWSHAQLPWLPSWLHCQWAGWAMTRVAGESGWCPQNGLSYLPKILLSEITLWWAFTWDQLCSSSGEVYLRISSPDLLVAVSDHLEKPFSTSLWPSSQTISHNWWTDINPYFWASLLLVKMGNQVNCSNFHPLGKFALPLSFKVVSEGGCSDWYSCPLLGGVSMSCTTLCKPEFHKL